MRNESKQPLTPPSQSEMSLSPNPSTMHYSPLKVPISPPHSNYSDDGWLHPKTNNMNSISPSSDQYDNFNSSSSQSIKQEPVSPYSSSNYTPEEMMNNLMFVDPSSNQMKTEYNTGNLTLFSFITPGPEHLPSKHIDMMDSLDLFQNLVDNGSISPNSLNMSSEDQLNNFNVWLAQLTESIDQEQQPPSIGYNQVSPTVPMTNNYSEMLLQFNSSNLPVNSANDLYPTTHNPEEDLYVRSQPIIQQQQTNVDYTSKLYGDFAMPPMMDNLNQYSYPITTDVAPPPHMNGLRQHYVNVPGLVSNNNYFAPELRSAQKLGSSKDNVQYKKNPNHSQEKEEKAAESFKPIKPSYHESKKNVATMMNVFASADSNPTKKSVELKQSPAKKSTKDILDLLVSDMSDLAIEKREKDTTFKEEETSLYPTSSSVEMVHEKHKKLLVKLSQWVNQNYTGKNNQPKNHITSSSSPSVQVQ